MLASQRLLLVCRRRCSLYTHFHSGKRLPFVVGKFSSVPCSGIYGISYGRDVIEFIIMDKQRGELMCRWHSQENGNAQHSTGISVNWLTKTELYGYSCYSLVFTPIKQWRNYVISVIKITFFCHFVMLMVAWLLSNGNNLWMNFNVSAQITLLLFHTPLPYSWFWWWEATPRNPRNHHRPQTRCIHVTFN